jgi:heavy metal sensor kinase
VNARSIKFRLVAWYAGLLTGIFLLLCAGLYLDLRNSLESNVRASQTRRAHELANGLLAHVKQVGESGIAGEIKEWYAPESNDRFIRVTRSNGAVIYASGKPKNGSFDPVEVPALAAAPVDEMTYRQKLSGGTTLMIAVLNFKSDGNPDYLVEFGTSLDSVQSMLSHLFLQLSLGLPLAVGIITVGGYLLVQRALRPVEHITSAAEQITQLNLSDRLPVAKSGDELDQLSTTLNRMIARLDDAFQNSKRFAADASHDLRTPLTILRGELESLVDDPGQDKELRDKLGGLLEEVIHLSKIVEQLFTLTQLDNCESRAEWKRFDLAELARTTADQMSLLAEDKKISLACAADTAAYVHGDRSRIKQVVVNLLDNAFKYTPAEGRVALRVQGGNGCAILEIEDTGIGIPADALPHVFERFFRVDKTRSAEAKSAGLGLSIVKSICAAHGGSVEASSVLNEGSRFTVKLPSPKN